MTPFALPDLSITFQQFWSNTFCSIRTVASNYCTVDQGVRQQPHNEFCTSLLSSRPKLRYSAWVTTDEISNETKRRKLHEWPQLVLSARCLLYSPPFQSHTFCPHRLFTCLIRFSQWSVITSLNSINSLLFATKTYVFTVGLRTYFNSMNSNSGGGGVKHVQKVTQKVRFTLG